MHEPALLPEPAQAEPAPNRVWPSFATLGVALLFILVGGCGVGAVFGVAGVPPTGLMQMHGFMPAVLGVSSAATLLAVLRAPAWFNDVGAAGLAERVAWRGLVNPLDVVLIAVGSLMLGGAALTLFAAVAPGNTGILADISASTRAASGVELAAMLLCGALMPGVIEELTFRGLLQTRLIERWGPFAGIACTAVMFGVWHFDVRQGVMAAVIGAWFGVWAFRLRSVVPVAFAHTLHNATAFVAQRVWGDQASASTLSLPLKIAVPLGIAGVMTLILLRPRSPERAA